MRYGICILVATLSALLAAQAKAQTSSQPPAPLPITTVSNPATTKSGAITALAPGDSTVVAIAKHEASPSPETARQPRTERPIGFKVGFAALDKVSGLGVQADYVLFNRLGLELGSTISQTTARAHVYILSGGISPFVGAGTGFAFEFGEYLGSWKEVHVGLESAFANGLVLQIQAIRFFDVRGLGDYNFTLSPGVGFRL